MNEIALKNWLTYELEKVIDCEENTEEENALYEKMINHISHFEELD